MKLSYLKNQTDLNSEQILDIIPQPEPNCPFLDAQIQRIATHLTEVTMDDSTRELLLDVKYSLGEIRTRFEILREWGQQWKDDAKTMMDEHDVKFISDKVYNFLNNQQELDPEFNEILNEHIQDMMEIKPQKERFP